MSPCILYDGANMVVKISFSTKLKKQNIAELQKWIILVLTQEINKPSCLNIINILNDQPLCMIYSCCQTI